MSTENKNNTLGYHYDMSSAILGKDSKATKFIEKKIAESANGRDEVVIVEEGQFVGLLWHIHNSDDQE